MSSNKQMLINYVPGQECRVALVVDGALEEFHSERAGSVSFVGNIYLGTVTNVEPGIQAAFIDFGQATNGFLHVSDLHPMYFPGETEETTEQIGKKTPRKERPPIQKCLKRGQKVIVQVLKESINTKGPTLTTYLSIPGRYLVMLPQMDKVGVSRKVEDDELRREMRIALDSVELPEGFGFIMRTAGAGKGKTELKRDLAYLLRLHKDIERRKKGSGRSRLLYAESDLLMRCLRDIWTSDVNEIVIDHEPSVQRAAKFMKIVSPRSSTRLLHYDSAAPMFHAYGIEEQIQRIYSREVPLPSGGSLVIDETEAMIAIDVNSGKMRDAGDAETTAYKTNVEAVDEICRQLRLRDIGGLVVCDLIDMHGRGNRRKIETQFRDRLKKDRAATRTLPISRFGIVEMTRQRVRGSMRDVHYARCPTCTGRGFLQRPESVVTEVLRDLAALLEHAKVTKVELVVSARVAGEILSTRRSLLSRIEHASGKHVDVRIVEGIPVDRVNMYAYDASGADIELDRLPRLQPPKKLTEWVDTNPADEDWAVDINEEAAEEIIPEPEHIAEPIVEDLPSDSFYADEEEEEAAPAGKKKRRRRRRRRGRGGEGEGEGEEGSDVSRPSAPVEREERPEPAREGRGGEGGESEGDGEGEGGGRRRRRRRRRRGRGGAREEGVESDGGRAPTPAPAPARRDMDDEEEGDEEIEIEVPDPSIKRGDSWDLTPEEIAAAEARRAKALAALKTVDVESPSEQASRVAPEGEGEDEAPRKKKRRRSRRKKTVATGSAPAEGASVDASPVQSEAEAVATTASDDAVVETASDGTESAAKKVARSRRRGSRDEEAPGAADDAGSEADDGAGGEGDDGAVTQKKTKRKRRSKKKASSGGASGEESSGGGDTEPVVETRLTKTALAAQVRESGGSGDGTRKPPRTLYSSRRRVSPTDLKSRRDRE